MSTAPSTQQVVFIVPPLVHVLDLAGPVQLFYEAIEYGAPYQLRYCSFQNQLISSAGLAIGPVESFTQLQLQPSDLLVIPGMEMGYIRSTALKTEQDFLTWLREQHHQGIIICSVCTGAFLVAQAGLLDGRKCTTHWKRLAELQTTYPQVITQQDRLFIQDSGVYTSAGVTAGIDMALAILEERQGPLFVSKIARELVVYLRRGPHHSQKSVYLDYRNHINVAVHQVQDWLITNLQTRITLDELAQVAGMSTRNLTRTFRKETGLSICDYTTLLRLERARTLRQNPGMTLEAIAGQCGFQDARQLRRIWQQDASKNSTHHLSKLNEQIDETRIK
ncbi:GlxA family transcriptional regulator [Spirosoma endbachense]|uniref:Helix-turn-helix domain-containing protein n=1 Tax=Spirosoma endbachense TaxID=2666025 RepID=A0A6P1W1Y9_9BACT|nr:DJ-1/PfpI family protein [Spirosoma endbachense]QHV99441.1 helix-turn-helix domain-containing protein [Spirosoma endbachense]